MSKQDVIDLVRGYAASHPADKEILDGVVDFLLLKFRQDTYDRKFERNHGSDGRLREGTSDSISDGVSG